MAGTSPFPYVGDDVVINILSKLPVKSLLRFRCVCKSWYAIIESPYFITNHLQQRNLPNQNYAPLIVISNKSDKGIYMISSNNNNIEEELLENFPLIDLDPQPFSHGLEDIFMGPVKGIYCLVTSIYDSHYHMKRDNISLCNPALRQVKNIPQIPLLPMSKVFGFGFDSKSNDFKVVAIIYDGPKFVKFVYVYTLSSNSWRAIDGNINFNLRLINGPGVFLSHGNGVVHRLSYVSEQNKEILSFELGTEVFKHLQLPPGVTYRPQRNPNATPYKDVALSVSNDSIVVFYTTYEYSSDDYYYEIWVMKEYGVKDSWTKLYNIGPLYLYTEAFTLWKNDQILFQEFLGLGGCLVSYDPHCQQSEDLQILNPFRVFTYMESLVSIN